MIEEVYRIENVTTKEGNRIYLNNFNLAIAKGQCLALVNVDSFGIDSLLSLVNNNIKVEYGRVFYQEKLINDYKTDQEIKNLIPIIDDTSKLIGDLSVADNIFNLSRESEYLINKKKIQLEFNQLIQEVGGSFEATDLVQLLNPLERCIIELVKNVHQGAKIVVIKEISNSMSAKDLLQFFKVVRIFLKRGISILYICNHHEEAILIGNQVGIFSNGHIIKIFNPRDYQREYFKKIYSKAYAGFSNHQLETGEQERIRFQKVSSRYLQDFNLTVYGKECVTIWDRDNQGTEELLSILNGKIRNYQGKIIYKGTEIRKQSAGERIRKGFVVVDYIESMIFRELSYEDNLGFLYYNNSDKAEYLHKRREISDYIKCYQLKKGDPLQLSYEEKIHLVYHRVLLATPELVLVNQPFYKADMYHRQAIIKWLLYLREQDIAVIILSKNLSDTLIVSNQLVALDKNHNYKIYQKHEFLKFTEEATIL